MLIHKTKKENRESILKNGLIPKDKYVWASMNFLYWNGIIDQRYDYYIINESVDYVPCPRLGDCVEEGPECKYALAIAEAIKPEYLTLYLVDTQESKTLNRNEG